MVLNISNVKNSTHISNIVIDQKKLFSFYNLVCADRGLTDLRQGTNILANGWKSNSEALNVNYDDHCDTADTWYGYTGGRTVGSIFTTFHGNGTAHLSFGNCCPKEICPQGTVKAFLNGKTISEALAKQTKNVAFDYSVGDKLTIAEYYLSIWKLHSLGLDCN